jgi:hypothetical protein
VSNIVVSGKGRRYRRNWRERRRSPATVLKLFLERARTAAADVHQYRDRPNIETEVIHGDARDLTSDRQHDIAIFSPPYPNSFDYTDVYNVELWMLGYLKGAEDNRSLRLSTLTSHVQLHRDFTPPPEGSDSLDATLKRLEKVRGKLWNRWITAMIGAYFADLIAVLQGVRNALDVGGPCCVVIGDSSYGGVHIPTGRILEEVGQSTDWHLVSSEPVRAMRSSAQQGGGNGLTESLIVFRS